MEQVRPGTVAQVHSACVPEDDSASAKRTRGCKHTDIERMDLPACRALHASLPSIPPGPESGPEAWGDVLPVVGTGHPKPTLLVGIEHHAAGSIEPEAREPAGDKITALVPCALASEKSVHLPKPPQADKRCFFQRALRFHRDHQEVDAMGWVRHRDPYLGAGCVLR